MNRYLLLILLTSWSLLVTHSKECDTGVAFVNSILSIGRSSLANADVAILESYTAQNVEKCMEDCCSGKYGSCTIASFKKNSTKNCLHFNCRPLKQCKFTSSNTADSFTFSSDPRALHPVPSTSYTSTTSTTQIPSTTPKTKSAIEEPRAVEEIATFSEEQDDLKNDNTSVKPRKGVSVATLDPDAILNKSGVKPRKGVSIEDVPHSKFFLKGLNKSNVKPRKGVITYLSNEVSHNIDNLTDISSKPINTSSYIAKQNFSDSQTSNDLALELAKLFEDDTVVPSTLSSLVTQNTPSRVDITSPKFFSSTEERSTSSERHFTSDSYSSTVEPSSANTFSSIFQSTVKPVSKSETGEQSSSSSMLIASAIPSLSARTRLTLDEPKLLNRALAPDSQESDKEKKYKSSMHLVLSLIFGLLVLSAVLGVVAKRMYDSWQRRDYYRMNYLIDGIYNGYD